MAGPAGALLSLFAPQVPPTSTEVYLINLTDFDRFNRREFHLPQAVGRLREPRPAWEIPLSHLVYSVLYGAATGAVSLHQIDQRARWPEARACFQTSRDMVASDSTLQRVLPGVAVEEVAGLRRHMALAARQMGFQSRTLPDGRRVRLGVVDGTVLCGRFCSVLDLVGEIDTLVDFEPFEKKGDELPASERLLRRHAGLWGSGFVDYLLYDGLGITQGMLRLADELDVHLVVKSKELETLLILQDAQALFEAPQRMGGVEYVSGVDEERGLEYEVWAATGFEHQGIGPLRVARVRERNPKHPEKPAEEFWVITTDPMLGALTMRELGKTRWSIENGGFRALNALAASKHQWVQAHRRKASEEAAARAEAYFAVVLSLLMVAYTLVQAYLVSMDEDEVRQVYGAVHLTVAFVSERLLATMGEARLVFGSDG